ncbi:MarR family winged helix-turn-helix transcriptional regulator [Mycolicibacterium hodleri]|uniref:MarR family transcriptional regulator n=1 Tax=Mycolicibacterium hodleri TaxID=49897 RepID=A0A502EGQ3_9MYCO|nr:MarR family transcriptional regulator [Mycolicibacterium hodleri]TPG35680.1 MarR family transcriptional regulator [Mycolicibacterium hodleri]
MRSTKQDDHEVHERVMRLTQRLVAEADKFNSAFVDRHRMHPTDVNALIRVRVGREQGESTTAGWLGVALGLTSGAVTAVVDRLERSGHLRRVRDQHDRRRVILENSPGGQHLVDQYFAPIRQRSEEVMDRFTSAELEVVSRFLGATAAAMAAQRESLITEQHGGMTAGAQAVVPRSN